MSDWESLRKTKKMITSPSQHETFMLCERKWWLSKVRRLKEPQTHSQTFGTVLHSVCERYLRADDNGLDENGHPVDLFPPGWEIAEDRFAKEDDPKHSVSEEEQALIRKLIDEAIRDGVLERKPHRMVEATASSVIMTIDDTEVEMFGIIDLAMVDPEKPEVQDHKTTKSMRWAKTPRTLAENTQIKIYMKELLSELENQGHQLPETVTLRHNVYCKDPDDPKVKKVEVEIPTSDVIDHWYQVIEPNARRMKELREKADKWNDVPDPPDMTKACNAYGGCSFRPICTGKITEKTYERKMEEAGKEKQMVDKKSSIASRAALIKKMQGNVEKEETNTEPQVEEEKPTVAREGDTAPPWAREECPACEGAGFNSRGATCQPCVKKTKTKISEYEISVEDGVARWSNGEASGEMFLGEGITLKPTDPKEPIRVSGPSSGTEGKVTKSTADKIAARKKVAAARKALKEGNEIPAEEPQSVPAPTTAEVEVPAEPKPAEPKPEKKKAPKKKTKKGFTLFINCAPVKGGNVMCLDDILEDLRNEMAEELGVESYYDIDAFARRDALSKAASAIIERAKGKSLIAMGVGTGCSDIKSVVEALRGVADTVIIGAGA
jgi:RecB family exonuclease